MSPATRHAAKATQAWGDVLAVVRTTVRDLLLSSPAFSRLADNERRDLAEAMVKVCHTAAQLIQEEFEQREHAEGFFRRSPVQGRVATPAQALVASAQSAGTEFSGVAASRVASTTQAILNAVSFPRFVTELINGVFQAMIHSSQQQMQSYVELLRNVAATTEGFADASMSNDRARSWLAERYPGSFEVARDEEAEAYPDEPPPESRLQLRPGASWPSEAALRADLGLSNDQSVPTGDPDRTLVPLARVALAQQRQQMLATLVMMGMQRIVVEGGRIYASMRFHIDTRSAAQEDRASQFDFRNTINASGSFGIGVWGASAAMTNTIGYVSTQKTQTTEEMNTDLDLSSSVEILFKSDYLPLNRLAGNDTIDKIRAHSLNPEEEAKAAAKERETRQTAQRSSEENRRAALDKAIPAPPKPPDAPKPGAPGTVEAAEEARKKKKKAAPPATPRPAAPGSRTPAGQTPPQRSGAPPGGAAPSRATPPQNSRRTNSGAARAAPPRQNAPPAQSEPPPPAASGEETTPPQAAALEATPDIDPPRPTPDVAFIPSWDECLDEMLTLAEIRPTDLVYDLGCGDGRLVILAAKRYGCRAVGFDVDPQRVAEARQNVLKYAVQDLVRIEERDLFDVNLRPATVVLLYLLPHLNARLLPQLRRLRPGARIVSQDFDLPGAVPDRVVQVYLSRQRFSKTFHLWRTPLKEQPTPARPEWTNATRFVPA